ncbi:hypothetical protein AB6846_18340 [Serratia proteamaculans]
MRDDERADPQVLDYLQAENAFTDAALKPQQLLREALYEKMVARIPQQEHSVPYMSGTATAIRRASNQVMNTRFTSASRRLRASIGDTLIHGNQRAEQREFYTLGGLEVSPDNQKLAVGGRFPFPPPIRHSLQKPQRR